MSPNTLVSPACFFWVDDPSGFSYKPGRVCRRMPAFPKRDSGCAHSSCSQQFPWGITFPQLSTATSLWVHGITIPASAMGGKRARHPPYVITLAKPALYPLQQVFVLFSLPLPRRIDYSPSQGKEMLTFVIHPCRRSPGGGVCARLGTTWDPAQPLCWGRVGAAVGMGELGSFRALFRLSISRQLGRLQNPHDVCWELLQHAHRRKPFQSLPGTSYNRSCQLPRAGGTWGCPQRPACTAACLHLGLQAAKLLLPLQPLSSTPHGAGVQHIFRLSAHPPAHLCPFICRSLKKPLDAQSSLLPPAHPLSWSGAKRRGKPLGTAARSQPCACHGLLRWDSSRACLAAVLCRPLSSTQGAA